MIIQNNDILSIGSFTGTYNKLPLGTYRLRQNPKTYEYYLVKTEDFVLPNKLYGDFKLVDRVLNTFSSQNTNLATLLVGSKGSGKTITAKKICIESKLPVIIIDEGYDDVELISFLSNPELGSCIILIDEYEKLYCNRDTNESIMLQILDGACHSHHLFILTVNEMDSFNSNLINRPSRIFYRKVYGSVPDETIKEILENELLNKHWKNSMLKVFEKFSEITFDILMSLIKEVNLYDESPEECVKLMNFCPQSVYVDIKQILKDGETIDVGTYTLFDGSSYIEIRAQNESERTWKYYTYDEITKISPTTWEINDEKEGYHFILVKSTPFKLLF